MNLFRITGRAGKCGPTALSAMTGRPSHETAAILRDLTGRTAIHGTDSLEMIYAMEMMGFPLKAGFVTKYAKGYHREGSVEERAPITLGRFDRDEPDGTWLISIKNHWIAYSKGYVADSGWLFSRKPEPFGLGSVARRAQIRAAYRFV